MLELIPIYLIIIVYGICIGSFLNVCIYRIPKKENIIIESSHCMSCGRKLRWYELIPLLSFIIQGGKCRGCKTKLSVQYPIIELSNGLLYLVIFLKFGFTLQTLLYMALTSVLIVISVIDFRTYEIPFGCNVFIFVLGVIRVIIDLPHMSKYVIGFFAISAFLYILYYFSKGRAIGGGDIKLMAAAGLLLGFDKIILAFVIGCVVGSILHIIRMKLSGKNHMLAFGPYLSIGIWISMMWGEELIKMYLNSFM